jgi:hypothetical protein
VKTSKAAETHEKELGAHSPTATRRSEAVDTIMEFPKPSAKGKSSPRNGGSPRASADRSRHSLKSDLSSGAISRDGSDEEDSEEEEMKVVNELGFGASFGERAIRQRIPRTATITAKEDCHFAMLSQDAYNKIVAQYDEKVFMMKINFLRQITLIQNWGPDALGAIIYQANQVEFTRKQIIYKPGDKADSIYFISSGEIEVSKTLVRDEREELQDAPKKKVNPMNAVWNQSHQAARSFHSRVLPQALTSRHCDLGGFGKIRFLW